MRGALKSFCMPTLKDIGRILSYKGLISMSAIDFTHAFQPIVNVVSESIYSYEALIRGVENQGAGFIFDQIPQQNLNQFIVDSNIKAFKLAAKLHLSCKINVNFSPSSFENSDQIHSFLEQFIASGLSAAQLVVELTEAEIISCSQTFFSIIANLRQQGVTVAIDDFGAGYAGLNLLVDFQPDLIKLDMHLIRDIHRHGPKQAVVKAILSVCLALGIDIIAEGVETYEEFSWLARQGIELFQGYLIAKPGFKTFPAVIYPKANLVK